MRRALSLSSRRSVAWALSIPADASWPASKDTGRDRHTISVVNRTLRKAVACMAAAGVVASAGVAGADKPIAKSARVATASASAYTRDNGDGSGPHGYVSSTGNGSEGNGRATVSTSTKNGNARASA